MLLRKRITQQDTKRRLMDYINNIDPDCRADNTSTDLLRTRLEDVTNENSSSRNVTGASRSRLFGSPVMQSAAQSAQDELLEKTSAEDANVTYADNPAGFRRTRRVLRATRLSLALDDSRAVTEVNESHQSDSADGDEMSHAAILPAARSRYRPSRGDLLGQSIYDALELSGLSAPHSSADNPQISAIDGVTLLDEDNITRAQFESTRRKSSLPTNQQQRTVNNQLSASFGNENNRPNAEPRLSTSLSEPPVSNGTRQKSPGQRMSSRAAQQLHSQTPTVPLAALERVEVARSSGAKEPDAEQSRNIGATTIASRTALQLSLDQIHNASRPAGLESSHSDWPLPPSPTYTQYITAAAEYQTDSITDVASIPPIVPNVSRLSNQTFNASGVSLNLMDSVDQSKFIRQNALSSTAVNSPSSAANRPDSVNATSAVVVDVAGSIRRSSRLSASSHDNRTFTVGGSDSASDVPANQPVGTRLRGRASQTSFRHETLYHSQANQTRWNAAVDKSRIHRVRSTLIAVLPHVDPAHQQTVQELLDDLGQSDQSLEATLARADSFIERASALISAASSLDETAQKTLTFSQEAASQSATRRASRSASQLVVSATDASRSLVSPTRQSLTSSASSEQRPPLQDTLVLSPPSRRSVTISKPSVSKLSSVSTDSHVSPSRRSPSVGGNLTHTIGAASETHSSTASTTPASLTTAGLSLSVDASPNSPSQLSISQQQSDASLTAHLTISILPSKLSLSRTRQHTSTNNELEQNQPDSTITNDRTLSESSPASINRSSIVTRSVSTMSKTNRSTVNYTNHTVASEAASLSLQSVTVSKRRRTLSADLNSTSQKEPIVSENSENADIRQEQLAISDPIPIVDSLPQSAVEASSNDLGNRSSMLSSSAKIGASANMTATVSPSKVSDRSVSASLSTVVRASSTCQPVPSTVAAEEASMSRSVSTSRKRKSSDASSSAIVVGLTYDKHSAQRSGSDAAVELRAATPPSMISRPKELAREDNRRWLPNDGPLSSTRLSAAGGQNSIMPPVSLQSRLPSLSSMSPRGSNARQSSVAVVSDESDAEAGDMRSNAASSVNASRRSAPMKAASKSVASGASGSLALDAANSRRSSTISRVQQVVIRPLDDADADQVLYDESFDFDDAEQSHHEPLHAEADLAPAATQPMQPRKTRPPRQKYAGTIPKNMVWDTFKHFLGPNVRLPKSCLPLLCQAVEQHMANVRATVQKYAGHAGRARVTQADYRLLLRRQRFYETDAQLLRLCQQHLDPMMVDLVFPRAVYDLAKREASFKFKS